MKQHVLLRIRTELLDRIGYLKDNGRLASDREQHDIAVRLLQLRIESVKNSFPFVCHTV